jgi:hypothetical protein
VPVGTTDEGGVPQRRILLALFALLLAASAAVGCGGGEADSSSAEAAAATSAPAFCADPEGRGQANLLYQLLPQIAASPDGGKSLFENPVFTGPDLDALTRHIDAVEAAPPAEADAGGEIKSRYVEAMRSGVDAYRSAKEGDASKLSAASPAVDDAYLAFATPYACS